MSASALPGENRTNKIWVEMNRNTSKSILNIIDCDWKKEWQILIIFGAHIFDNTCHQMTILVPTLPNVCFCTTWGNPNTWNRIKMQYFVDFVSSGNAEADNGCGGKLVWSPFVSETSVSKIIKIWQSFFTLQSKMSGMFFSRHGVYTFVYVIRAIKALTFLTYVLTR